MISLLELHSGRRCLRLLLQLMLLLLLLLLLSSDLTRYSKRTCVHVEWNVRLR